MSRANISAQVKFGNLCLRRCRGQKSAFFSFIEIYIYIVLFFLKN